MYNILKRIIINNNYGTLDEIRNKIDVFYAVNPPRLTDEEYRKLNEMLNAKESVAQKEEVKRVLG